MPGPTASSLASPSLSGGSWRPRRTSRWLSSRRSRRVLITATGIVALGLLAYLLARPFWHPRTRVLLLSPVNSLSIEAPAARYAAVQQESWERLAPVLSGSAGTRVASFSLNALTPPRSPFEEAIGQSGSATTNVVIVSVETQASEQNGRPVLLLRNRDLQNPPPARLGVSELLDRICRCAAAVKLVVLDLGDVASDLPSGVLVNRAGDLVEKLVRESNDASLWVLVSHDGGQISHASTLLGETVFNHFVVRGLEGAADANGDRAVDIHELERYVSGSVAAWVDQSTAGAASQHPRLFWGGGDSHSAGRAPLIVPVARGQPAPSRTDFTDLVSAAGSRQKEPSPFAAIVMSSEANALAGGGLSRVQSTAASASSALANPTGAAPLPAPLARVTSLAARVSGATKSDKKKDGAPADTAAAGAEKAGGEAKTSPAEGAALLLAQGWSLRDELASRGRFDISPVDFAPHLWRELEAELLAAERLVRYGSPDDTKAVAALIEREILPLGALYDPSLPAIVEPQTLAEQLAAALPRETWNIESLPSLGLAEVVGLRTRRPLPEALEKCRAALDAFLATSFTREALAKLVAGEPIAAGSHWREVQLARQLAAIPEIDAATCRQMLVVVRRAERIAAHPRSASAWLRPRLLEADGWVANAQRAALDQVRGDWRARAEEWLTQADERYLEIERDLARLEVMHRLRADLTYRATDYVQLFIAAGSGDGAPLLVADDVSALLAGLKDLSTMLDRSNAANWTALQQSATSVAAAAQRVEKTWQPQRLAAELDADPQPGVVWQWECLLGTALVDAGTRVRLLTALPEREGRLAERFVGPLEWRQSHDVDKQKSSANRHQQDSARLAAALASLADGTNDIKQALSALPNHVERSQRALPQLADASKRRGAIAELASALSAARMIDARDVRGIEWPAFGSLDSQSRQWDLLELAYERALATRRGARASESAQLTDVARAYQRLADAVPGQPKLGDPAAEPLRAVVPEIGSLMEVASLDLPVEFTSQRSYDVPLWIALDYDPQALAVDLLGAGDVDHLPKRSASAAADEAQGPPSITLPPAGMQTLRLRVRRLTLPIVPAKVVLHVASRETASRHVIDVELPTRPRAEIVVQGTPGTWAAQSDRTLLQPFANRTTIYELGLASKASEALSAEVQIFAPTLPVGTLPPGGIPAALAKRILARLEAVTPLAESGMVTLAANGSAPLLLAKPKPPEVEPPPMAPAAPPMAAAAPMPPPAAKDAPTALPHGLIAAVTDHGLNRVVLVHLPAWPQKPRRFVKATAAYDEKKERVSIHVAPEDPALMPAGGVKIRADFGSALPTGAQARTEDVLQAPAWEATLYGDVPSSPGRVVTVHVDVDDYPRAFTFEVPCHADAVNIPEQTDRVSLSIVRLPRGTAYKAPALTIPVELKIDVPPTAQLDSADVLEVGIDQRRDRELVGDAPLRLSADRHAEVQLLPLGDDGRIKLQTRVTDLVVDLPAPGLQNAKVNVLARALIGDREVFSPPVELLLDGAAPRYELPQLLPSRSVATGTEVTLSVLMVDEGQSGVEKVEMAIDATGAGKFLEKPPPVPAVLNKSGRWEAKLATKDLAPGVYTILIHAVDRVGNDSGFLPLKGLVIQSPVAGESTTLGTITGVAMFGSRPVNGFDVSLEGPKKLSAKTDDQGKFTIKNVPAGKYKVTVSGVVRNKPSQAEADVTIAPPAAVPSLELQVR